jgi:protocatechuate 3,4-dioxygenase beta subunit
VRAEPVELRRDQRRGDAGGIRRARPGRSQSAGCEIAELFGAVRHPHPSPNFEGYGVVTTDEEGRYRYKTIKPSPYPIIGTDIVRPAHIHYDILGRYDRIVTQMYFEGDPYNEKDQFLQSIRRPERLIAKPGQNPADAEPGSQALVSDLILPTG